MRRSTISLVMPLLAIAIILAMRVFLWPASTERDASMIQEARSLERIHKPLPPDAVSVIKAIGEGHRPTVWRVTRAKKAMDSILDKDKKNDIKFLARKIIQKS